MIIAEHQSKILLVSELAAGIALLGIMLSLTTWTLHVGGLRNSRTLTYVERRFPGLANHFRLISVKRDRELIANWPGKAGTLVTVVRTFSGVMAAVFFCLSIFIAFEVIQYGVHLSQGGR